MCIGIQNHIYYTVGAEYLAIVDIVSTILNFYIYVILTLNVFNYDAYLNPITLRKNRQNDKTV